MVAAPVYRECSGDNPGDPVDLLLELSDIGDDQLVLPGLDDQVPVTVID